MKCPTVCTVQMALLSNCLWLSTGSGGGDKKGGRVGIGELSQQHKAPFSLQKATECPTMAHAKLSLTGLLRGILGLLGTQ